MSAAADAACKPAVFGAEAMPDAVGERQARGAARHEHSAVHLAAANMGTERPFVAASLDSSAVRSTVRVSVGIDRCLRQQVTSGPMRDLRIAEMMGQAGTHPGLVCTTRKRNGFYGRRSAVIDRLRP
jgi:hypothetical protein